MVHGPLLFVIIVLGVLFIVFATAKWRLHPFLSLIVAAFGVGICSGMPLSDVVKNVNNGFGGLMGSIGIVIVCGTIIGTIMERTGAALRMADAVLRLVGPNRPQLAMSLIGAVVSIPVFCDSGFVILSSLMKALARRASVPMASMAVALATGLYTTHTLVPPTPGPIAAAANVGASADLGAIIGIGLIVSIPTMLAGYVWARFQGRRIVIEGEDTGESYEDVVAKFDKLPSTFLSFLPILLPIVLIAVGSVVSFTKASGPAADLFNFLGQPLVALIIGVFASFTLLPKWNEETLTNWVGDGLKDAASIILITGAGGAFGKIISQTPVAAMIKNLAHGGISGVALLLIAFLVAAALKTAQGSSTTALVVTSSLLSPLLVQAGIHGALSLSLVVMAIGAGAMAVSHVNDSYFWVVTQFSGMRVTQAYKAQTAATLVQGIVTIVFVNILWLIFVH
ncbi:GntP family permease [Alicyclobacillus dauci]|uniref:GntP family permease n=1 Tax=Alicyclobacillus dauci TaxID=1475485 RepID=A0ABY6Z651_9BACL|nr:GntP family permease [Alicyclobacillus dauci]WAH37791.1 GntP family permease [Alicyclobacillus dauci]